MPLIAQKICPTIVFLVVKTNVDYQVVGSFVLQNEASTNIEKALKVISDWNPDWSPKSFLVDYSESEIGAVERLFPGKKVDTSNLKVNDNGFR